MSVNLADPANSSSESLFGQSFRRRLDALAELAETYQAGQPFPHILIDDFLPVNVLQKVVDTFPDRYSMPHREYDDEHQVKLEYTTIEVMPATARELLCFFNSSPMLQFLEKLTGITGLIPDPHLTGGGLHQIEPGGKLDIHADFNRLERLKLDRRLNLLLYLNHDWKEEYGGHFELWDASMTKCVKKMLPIFNRCVVFSTTSNSYHGHPIPLSCPKGITRRSMALYYYTNGRPEEEQNAAHSTLFQNRPGVVSRPRNNFRKTAKNVVRSLLPPIITQGINYLRGRRR
jgi:Rps23 Pro-64 3,4-dihydroxylase Tpa1-like proline 4-hydroxylase